MFSCGRSRVLQYGEKIACVLWSHGKYSNAYRSTIVDSSPLKEGLKVSVLWAKMKKEFSAVVECYPVQPASWEPSSRNLWCRVRQKLNVDWYVFTSNQKP